MKAAALIVGDVLSVGLQRIGQTTDRIEQLQRPPFTALDTLKIECQRAKHGPLRSTVSVKEGGARDIDPFTPALHLLLRLDDIGDHSVLDRKLAQCRLAVQGLLSRFSARLPKPMFCSFQKTEISTSVRGAK